MKLYYLVLGATVPGKFTEQHDVIFAAAERLIDLIPRISSHWNATEVHLDAWREVTSVDGYEILLTDKGKSVKNGQNLYFINLGGYKQGTFSEHHMQQLIVAPDISDASLKAKTHAFCPEHTIATKSRCHVDNKFGIDLAGEVDLGEMLSDSDLERFSVSIIPNPDKSEDVLHVGYFPVEELDENW